jgi:hypothetical protein
VKPARFFQILQVFKFGLIENKASRDRFLTPNGSIRNRLQDMNFQGKRGLVAQEKLLHGNVYLMHF